MIIKRLLWLLTVPTLLAAQTNPALTPDSLDFYRIQALLAPRQEARYELNHIGVLGQSSPNGFVVSAVLEGYPAHSAEIMRGDVIVSSNGSDFHPVYSFNSPQNAPDSFTPSDESYDLSVTRSGQPQQISVTPVFENLFESLNSATLNSIQQFSAGNKIIGYVHFWTLSRNSNDLVTYQTLVEALALCDGIILDLRDSYGYFDDDHLALFQSIEPRLNILSPSDWLRSWQRSNFPLESEPFRKPIAILINEFTEGGPEVLAHELAKTERIVTLGSPTGGLIGTYLFDQDTQQISYQPALETQIDGQQIEGNGLQPERLLEFPLSDNRRDDPQFSESINLLLGII